MLSQSLDLRLGRLHRLICLISHLLIHNLRNFSPTSSTFFACLYLILTKLYHHLPLLPRMTSYSTFQRCREKLEILPPYVVADLYQRRWRIEVAFCLVKRLLNLSYLWTGSLNAIKLQIWATWLFYAVLVDLGDAVADELGVPIGRISLEMIYRVCIISLLPIKKD